MAQAVDQIYIGHRTGSIKRNKNRKEFIQKKKN